MKQKKHDYGDEFNKIPVYKNGEPTQEELVEELATILLEAFFWLAEHKDQPISKEAEA